MVNMNVEFVICRCGDSQERGRCLFRFFHVYFAFFPQQLNPKSVHLSVIFITKNSNIETGDSSNEYEM